MDVIGETVEAVAIALLSATGILLLLRKIGPGVPLDAAMAKVLYEALPFAIGVGVARHFLLGSRNGTGEESRKPQRAAAGPHVNETVADLGAAAIGALFVAFNIAPTDEVPLLASELTAPFLLSIVAVSLVATYAIVFATDFSDHEKHRTQAGPLQSPIGETLAAYVVAILMSGFMLMIFQNLDPFDSWRATVGKVLVDFLPGGGTTEMVFHFPQDPANGRLDVRVTGYQVP